MLLAELATHELTQSHGLEIPSLSSPLFSGSENGSHEEHTSEHVRYDPIKRVAKYQRWVLLALLGIVTCNVLILFGFVSKESPLALPIRLLSFAILVCAIVAMYKLASQFFSPLVAVLCSIAIPIPLIGIITLLVINQKATKFLQRRGVAVGFLGASKRDL